MRDGVRLFTSVYVPKDKSQTRPILMQRTPDSVAPYGVDSYRAVIGPSEAAEKEQILQFLDFGVNLFLFYLELLPELLIILELVWFDTPGYLGPEPAV